MVPKYTINVSVLPFEFSLEIHYSEEPIWCLIRPPIDSMAFISCHFPPTNIFPLTNVFFKSQNLEEKTYAVLRSVQNLLNPREEGPLPAFAPSVNGSTLAVADMC